jgi:hypothetical protein
MTPEAVLQFIKERGDNVTFAELSRMDGASGHYVFELGENVVCWSGISKELCDALRDLREADRIHFASTSHLTYLIDGATLNLPLVKRVRAYRKPHWLPVVVKLGPDPKKKRAAPRAPEHERIKE